LFPLSGIRIITHALTGKERGVNTPLRVYFWSGSAKQSVVPQHT
jgi:hypothetical protein